MIKLYALCLLIFVTIEVQSEGQVDGEFLNQDGSQFTIGDVKNYIQPIVYQKLLRSPGDTPVIQEAKTVVSEYLVDTLLESAQNSRRSQDFARQATAVTQATNRPTVVSIVSGNLNITRPRPSQQHVISQVDNIIQNVNGGNITGIVDQALRIRAPPGVQQLVNGILNLVLCNPVNRLWNRCYGGGGIVDSLGR